MNDPFTDPTDRWGLIFHGSGMYVPQHSRQEWGRIADAIRTADRATAAGRTTDPTRHAPPTVRGDRTWCAIAADTYDRLTATGAYWHLAPGDTPDCTADEHLIRAWLDAPWVPPDAKPMTMAEAQGLDLEFAPGRDLDPTSLVILVDEAQRAGVFGAEHHRVGLLRWVESGTFRDDAFLITVRPFEGPGAGSPPVGIEQLVSDHTSPSAVIVGVLQAVARVVNEVLETTSPPARAAAGNVTAPRHGEHPPPPGPPMSPLPGTFQPLRLLHKPPIDPPGRPDPPTPPAAGGGRRR